MVAPRQVPLGLINMVLVYFIQKLPLKSPARVTLKSPDRMFGYVAWGQSRGDRGNGAGSRFWPERVHSRGQGTAITGKHLVPFCMSCTPRLPAGQGLPG